MPNPSISRLAARFLLALSILSADPALAVEAAAGHQYTTSELRNYATTLVAVIRVRQALATRLIGLPNADRARLENEAAAQITKILQLHELDKAAFNAISARVESQPAIAARVNQMVMDKMIRG